MKKQLAFEKLLCKTEFTWREYNGGTLDIDIYDRIGTDEFEHDIGVCLSGEDLDKLIRFLVNHHLK